MKTIILNLNTTEMGAHEKSERAKKSVCVSPLHLGQLLNFHKEIHVNKLSDCRLHLL